MKAPFVLWFTGLPASGKSTLADAVFAELEKRGLPAERLDGDALRARFSDTGFTKEDRDAHVLRAGTLASELERKGVRAIVSLVSPYEAARREARALCKNFIEVHVATPLAVCEKRDPKGLYAKARRGELKGLTGIDDPYEPPKNCELVLDTADLREDEAASLIMKKLEGWL